MWKQNHGCQVEEWSYNIHVLSSCVSVIHLKSAKRITHKVYGHNTYQVNMVLLIHTESQNWYLSHL